MQHGRVVRAQDFKSEGYGYAIKFHGSSEIKSLVELVHGEGLFVTLLRFIWVNCL